MSSLWILASRAYPDDPRCEDTKTARFWLRPGRYTVGRTSNSDIPVVEDRSISRTHAVVTVPSVKQWENGDGKKMPYVVIKDKSKFGTLVADADTKRFDVESSIGEEAIAYDKCLIRFGSSSPFR